MSERVANASMVSDLLDTNRSFDRLPWSDHVRVWFGLTARSLPPSLAREIQLSIFRSTMRVMVVLALLGSIGTAIVTATMMQIGQSATQMWLAAQVVLYIWIFCSARWIAKRVNRGTLTLAQLNLAVIGPVTLGGGLWGVATAVVGDDNFVRFSASTTAAATFAAIGFFWVFGDWPLCMWYSTLALAGSVASYARLDPWGGTVFGLLGLTLLSSLFTVSLFVSRGLFMSMYDTIVARDRKQLLELLLRDHERDGLDFLWETEDLNFGPIPTRMKTAAGGDERVREGRSLLALIDDPIALSHIERREAFDTTVSTSGPNGPGELRLSGRPKMVGGMVGGYRGVGTDAATARRANEAERIRERLDSTVTLTGGLAHDFNNQLATVLGAVELIALDPGLNDTSQDLLERAREACMRTRRITSDLVVASGHSTTYEAVPFELEETVRQVVADVGPLYPEAQITVVARRSAWVETDRLQYMRAVRNLIENGCQAALDQRHPSGREPCVCVTVELETADGLDWAVTEVADTGPGLDAETKDVVFEPFFTTRRHLGGTGLGLSIVRGLAHQADGRLSVHNADGAVFRLAIPAVEPPSVIETFGTPSTKNAAWAPEFGGVILVVEDEPNLALNVRQLLENFGARVEIADSVESALTGFLHRVDDLECVISDIALPDGEGYEVIAQLRSQVPDLKAVYMSGFTRTIPSTIAPELRCPVLPKPFSTAEFFGSLRSAGIGIPALSPDV